jgi:hypothetical protein
VRRLAIATLAALLLPAAGAGAENGYNAQCVAESPNEVLFEAGETTTSWFEFKNAGVQTWTRDVVRLGTSMPHDRASEFANSDWLQANRATSLDRASVPTGATGRFTFIVQARRCRSPRASCSRAAASARSPPRC